MKIKLTREQKLNIVVPAVIVGAISTVAAVAMTVVFKDQLKHTGGDYSQFLDALLEETRAYHDRALEAGVTIIQHTPATK